MATKSEMMPSARSDGVGTSYIFSNALLEAFGASGATSPRSLTNSSRNSPAQHRGHRAVRFLDSEPSLISPSELKKRLSVEELWYSVRTDSFL